MDSLVSLLLFEEVPLGTDKYLLHLVTLTALQESALTPSTSFTFSEHQHNSNTIFGPSYIFI